MEKLVIVMIGLLAVFLISVFIEIVSLVLPGDRDRFDDIMEAVILSAGLTELAICSIGLVISLFHMV